MGGDTPDGWLVKEEEKEERRRRKGEEEDIIDTYIIYGNILITQRSQR